MDELTALREYRADEPGPTAAETAAARTALLAAIEAGPARPGKTSRRFWLPAAAAAAAGLAVTGLIVSSGPAGRARPTATVDAAFVLHQAARSAARQEPASGRYFFTESEYVSRAVEAVPVRRGHGRITKVRQIFYWDGPALRRYWLGDNIPGLLEDPGAVAGPVKMPPGVPISGAGALTWAQVRHLPTAPQSLRRIVAGLARRAGEQPRPVAEFRVISELLFESPAPPRLRGALYDLAATLPGVRLVRGAHDLVGRAATEVYQPGGWNLPGGGGQAMFFSPRTGAELGWAGLTGSGPQCPPSSVYAVLATGYVDSAGQVPPGTPRHLLPATVRKHVPGCAAP